MKINTNQINAFLIMGRTLSLSETAKRLYMTQPTVSRLIQTLEKELGCKLFERDTRSVNLTEQGIFWHRRFSRIWKMIGDGIKETSKRKDTETCLER